MGKYRDVRIINIIITINIINIINIIIILIIICIIILFVPTFKINIQFNIVVFKKVNLISMFFKKYLNWSFPLNLILRR